MLTERESRGDDARRRLVAAALELLAAGGADAVSARELGEAAGISASAVNYHFGGREGLLRAAFEEAAAAARRWRAEALALAPPRVEPAALPAWMAALLQDACTDRRLPATALREFRQLACRSDAYLAVAAAEQADGDAFWSAVAGRSGLPAAAGPALSDFAFGAVAVHGRAADWRRELPWLHESCVRLAARLSGRREALPGWDGWRAAAAAAAAAAPPPAASPAADRMLDAAAGIVGRSGAGALTHRAVAALASASLANVSHHFPTRASLLRRTFRRIYQRVREGSTASLDTTPASIGALAAEVAAALVDEAGALNPGVLALHELMLAASRDPELRSEAEDLRALRGEGSGLAIARLRAAGPPPDPLDAHVTSILTLGAVLDAGVAPALERRARLEARMASHYAALFG